MAEKKENEVKKIETKYGPNFHTKRPVQNLRGKKAQKQFILDYLADSQQDFLRIMEQCKEQDPRLWLSIQLKLQLHVVPQDKNVNVNVGVNRDFLELQAMGRTKASSLPAANTDDETPVFTQYEEIKAEEDLTLKNK